MLPVQEKELIKLLKQGNAQAQKQLIQQYHLILKRVIVSFCGNHDSIDDILQETWIKIFNNIANFKGGSSIKTWMIRIVLNTAKTFFKKNSLDLEVCVDDFTSIENSRFKENGHWNIPPILWDTGSPENLLAQDQLAKVIKKAISKLPKLQSLIIDMYYLEGIKLKDICNLLKIKESNSRVQLHRARQQVYLAIENYYRN